MTARAKQPHEPSCSRKVASGEEARHNLSCDSDNKGHSTGRLPAKDVVLDWGSELFREHFTSVVFGDGEVFIYTVCSVQ